jgi:hypothetical protein
VFLVSRSLFLKSRGPIELCQTGRVLRRTCTCVALASLAAPAASTPSQEPSRPAQSARSPSDDQRAAGYLEAVLQRELGWQPGTYELHVEGGVATLRIARADREVREPQVSRLPRIEGLDRVVLELSDRIQPGSAFSPSHGGLPGLLGLSREDLWFPEGDVFLPLIADPKTPQFFASARHYDTPDSETTVGAVGFGENFGIWRRSGRQAGDGLQASLSAGLFAQFDLETDSANLVNTDYVVGLPLTWRKGASSLRLRVYHQSSHLGDEFLLAARADRINLSFESIELLASREWERWRGYLGGEYLFDREPSSLDPWGAHGGVEYRGDPFLFGRSLVGGVDLKSWEEHDYHVDSQLSFGLERVSATSGRHVRWMVDLYYGYSPNGQFYEDRIWFAGLGIYLGF